MPFLHGFCFAVSGQVKSAKIHGLCKAYCKFEMVSGKDWTFVEGSKDGLTQVAVSGRRGRCLVWNFPIEALWHSRNPFGWPQIVLAVYGLDVFGREIIQGYGSVHLPISAGHHECTVKLYRPRSTGVVQRLIEGLAAKPPEFVSLNFLAAKEGHEIVQTTSAGEVRLDLHVILKDSPHDPSARDGPAM